MAINQHLHDRIKVIAEELRQEVYGASGAPTWGTKFTDIEDVGVEIGDLLAREVIGQSLEDQASSMEVPTAVTGPDGEAGEIEVRIVQTRRGEVSWQEPKGYDKPSRKAFFPSVASVGDCAGRHGESSGVGEDGVRGDAES
jgi:hypothetical protein